MTAFQREDLYASRSCDAVLAATFDVAKMIKCGCTPVVGIMLGEGCHVRRSEGVGPLPKP